MEPFKYDPIDHDVPSFRLLRLSKLGRGGVISCQIFHARLDEREEAIPYEALSYTWGSPDLDEHIEVNGKRLDVTKNLYWALHNLCLRDQDRLLWVDAICINQSHPEERGHQVKQMGGIYKHADRVIFWLGLSTYETNVFMDSMHELQEEAKNHAYRGWTNADPRWMNLGIAAQLTLNNHHSDLAVQRLKGLEYLLDKRWFERVWILQEVANAKAAVVCCGTKSTPSQFFSMAPILMGVQPSLHCQAVLDIMPGPLRGKSWSTHGWDLHTLLKNFGESKAQDTRDMIYALLGIASDTKNSDTLYPDYGKSEAELLCSTIRFLYGCDTDSVPIQRPTSIRDLLKQIKSNSENDMTPSRWAAENGLIIVMKQLIDQGSEFKGKDTKGWTSLNYAISTWCEPMAQLLLKNGVEADSNDRDGRTPLSYAAEAGNSNAVQMLLEGGAEADSNDKQGRTPLSYAAEGGHLSIIKMLLEKGVKANSKDEQGLTPLSHAAEKQSNITQRLLEELVERHSTSEELRARLHSTDKEWSLHMAKEINSLGRHKSWDTWPGRTRDLSASLSKFIQIVQLLEKGLEADPKDKEEGRSLLAVAENVHSMLARMGLEADSKDKGKIISPLAVAENVRWILARMGLGGIFGVDTSDESRRTQIASFAEAACSLVTHLRVEARNVDIEG